MEIINRVANSKLISIDLEDWYQDGVRTIFDIKDWLFEGLILREKDFRSHVKEHDWSQYQDHYVVLTCSTDAIIPGWAYMLLTTALTSYSKKIVVGTLKNLEELLYQEQLAAIDFSVYKDKAVIVKGCSNQPVPDNAYIYLIQKIQPFAKSIMYGEACSSVPLFKKR